MVVDQGREAALQAIPDVPDEGTVLKQLAVLGEELLPQPGLQCFARVIGALQQRGQGVIGPGIAVGGGQQVQQTVGRRSLSAHRRDADDAVIIGVARQGRAALDPFALLVSQFHVRVQFGRPAVAEEAGSGDLESIPTISGVTMEDPLRGILGAWFWQTLRVSIFCNRLPMF